MAFYSWSTTAGTNASADASINWAEGQAPSSVNDSARAMMARLREFGNDSSGVIVTGGSSTAYTVTSNQGFSSLSFLNGQVVAFTAHTTNTAGSPSVTLNVDGLGAKPIVTASGADIPSGTLIVGTPYTVIYQAGFSTPSFVLYGMNNPYNIPIAAGMDYWAQSAPNSAFALCYGQAISRTTYSALFAIISTQYGSGDGSTTFNIPDKRGRVSVPPDNMGGTPANRVNLILGNPLGTAAGEQQHTLSASEIPSITSSGGALSVSISSAPNSFTIGVNAGVSTFAPAVGGGGGINVPACAGGFTGTTSLSGSTSAPSVSSNNTSGGAHNNVQPSIVCNYIMRII